jgi:Leucine-rich repeat (LRR) protein
LTHIPEEIEEMRMLERANFSYNRLLKFPEGLVKLKMLTYLDLSNNEIHSVHRDINNMKALEVLILDNNFITSFPPGLTYLTHLRRLSVLNNPLVTEEMKVDRVEDAVIPPEQKEEHCMICHSVLTDKPRPVYNFVDIGGVKNVPILYVVRDEKCQAVVAELADSEMQTFSTLVYD